MLARRQTGFRLTALLLAFVAAGLLAEVLLRVIGVPPPYRDRDEGDLIVPAPDVRYAYTPNLRDTLRTEDYTVAIAINSHGYRDEAWHIDETTVRILVIGNSFTAGYGVAAEARWPDRVEERLNRSGQRVQVFNAAVSGYNLQQMAATVQKLNDVVRPHLVLLGLYIDGLNRLHDPFVHYKGFSVRASIAESVHVEKNRLYLLHFDNAMLRGTEIWLQKHSRVFAVVLNTTLRIKQFLSQDTTSGSSALLEKTTTHLAALNETLTHQGIPLVLVPIVQHKSNGVFEPRIVETNRQLVAYCHENQMHAIDLLPTFRKKVLSGHHFWIGKDAHWNAQAHRVAADRIAGYLQQENLLDKQNRS